MSTQPECLSSPATRSNDVFISYAREDKAWVTQYLTRLLEAAEVGYKIDVIDFAAGRPLKKIIREAIKECRYTLLVVTDDYLKGEWTKFELKEAVKQNRAVPIKLRCIEGRLPTSLEKLLYLDLSDARTRDEEIMRLLRQKLEVSEDSIAKAQNSIAKKTLELLVELMAAPQVCEKVSKLRDMFVDIQQSNEILISNKQLHDNLQDIQAALPQLRDAMDEEGVNWDRIERATNPIRRNLVKLLETAATVKENVDVRFVDWFKQIADDLEDAVKSKNGKGLSSYMCLLTDTLGHSLVKINDRIVAHFGNRQLGELVDMLTWVDHEVADIEFDEHAADLLGKFRSGIKQLDFLDRTLRARVDDHNTFQHAEPILQKVIRNGEMTLHNISVFWRQIKDFIEKLKRRDRYDELLRCYCQLSQQMDDTHRIRDDQFEENVKRTFDEFVRQTDIAFHKLDIDLLDFSKKKLTQHNNLIQDILTRMATGKSDATRS